jgi:uncharacterized membrane protein YcaP (DUF421 family)
MELHKIVVRVVFAYLVLLALMRLSGKRVVSQAGALDFVVALIMGDLIDDLLWAEVGAAKFAVAAGGITFAGLLVALASYASPAAARVFRGRPDLVLRDGAPVRAGMRAQRLNEKELAELLRLEGIDRDRWSDVAHAWLEENGRLIVLLHDGARPADRRDRDALDGKVTS